MKKSFFTFKNLILSLFITLSLTGCSVYWFKDFNSVMDRTMVEVTFYKDAEMSESFTKKYRIGEKITSKMLPGAGEKEVEDITDEGKILANWTVSNAYDCTYEPGSDDSDFYFVLTKNSSKVFLVASWNIKVPVHYYLQTEAAAISGSTVIDLAFDYMEEYDDFYSAKTGISITTYDHKEIPGYDFYNMPAISVALTDSVLNIYYTRKSYTVTFNLNGGTINSLSNDITGNGWYDVTLASASDASLNAGYFQSIVNDSVTIKNGQYIFEGWSLEKDASTGKNISEYKDYKPDSDITFYAVYKPPVDVSIKVTAGTNDGIDSASNIPVTYSYNSNTGVLTLNAVSGYSEYHWFQNGDLLYSQTNDSITITIGTTPSYSGVYEYTVVAVDSSGNVKSGSITLNVTVSGVQE